MRALVCCYVERLGHAPLPWSGFGDGAPPEADVVVLEPAAPGALDAVLAMRAQRPELPVVCVSIYQPTAETRDLAPTAYLLKPFDRPAFEDALTAAVRLVERARKPGATV